MTAPKHTPLVERVAEAIETSFESMGFERDPKHTEFWHRAISLRIAQTAIAACRAEEMREVLRSALGAFTCTQRVEYYPQYHWSHRAKALLTKLDVQP